MRTSSMGAAHEDMPETRALLLSNSTNHGEAYLEHALPLIRGFLGTAVRTVAFVPFAGVTVSFDDYAELVRGRFELLGYTVESVHAAKDPAETIRLADVIAVGGGNTFCLLQHLYELGLRKAIREALQKGASYIGWSAGSNIACPTIRTTNDMPIVEPPSFDALDIIPFQINPHYLDTHPERHQGETREQRILEFVTINPGVYVVGLREGSALSVDGRTVRLLGKHTMRIFHSEETPREVAPHDDLQFLMSR